VTELVECSECRTRYDSEASPFCPRCGSVARGAPLPGALASARRADPARRRVQGAGAVLMAIGILFLASAALTLVVPSGDADAQLAEALARQPGGKLTVVFPANASANVTVRSSAGEVLATGNATGGRFVLDAAKAATLHVVATQGGAAWNRTAVVVAGDELTLALPAGGDTGTPPIAVGSTVSQAIAAGRWVFLAVAVVLAGGGLCALLLRQWPLAVLGAVVGAILGILALAAVGAWGLLFAAPFGFCAYAILGGRRHFKAAA